MLLNKIDLGELKAEAARRWDLAKFFRESWHVLESATPLVWSWHLDVVCRHVQSVLDGWATGNQTDVPRNLVIQVPPGSSKSRITSVCATAWLWLRRPDARIIAISGNPRVARRDGEFARTLIESPWYRETFRPRWKTELSTQSRVSNSLGGVRTAFGAGSKLTGDRCDVLILDDLLDARDQGSTTKRDAINRWYDTTAHNRVNQPGRSVRIGIQQRLHQADWAGYVLQRADWRELRIPQLAYSDPLPETWLGWRDTREPGQLLCPERFDNDALASERTVLGSHQWAAQHQQLPIPVEGAIIRRSWLRRFTTIGKLQLTVAAWDLGNSENPTQGNSYTVGQLWGVVWPHIYLLDQVRGHLSPLQAEHAIRDAQARWSQQYGPQAATLVEAKAAGPAVTERLRGQIPDVKPWLPSGSKIERLLSVSPLFEAGYVWVPHKHFATEYIDELCGFPAAHNDDQVDTTTMALQWVQRDHADRYRQPVATVVCPVVHSNGRPYDGTLPFLPRTEPDNTRGVR